MAKSAPSLIPAVLALLIIILFGYLIFTDLESTRTEHELPPIEIIEVPEQMPLTVIEEQNVPVDNEDVIEQEAKQFVKQLSQTTQSAVAIKEGNDQFVGKDTTISLPNIIQRATTLSSLLADTELAPETPITLDYTTETQTLTSLEALSNSIEDHTATITIITADGSIISKPLADIINQQKIAMADEVTLVELNKHHIETNYAQLSQLDIDPSQDLQASITLGTKELALSELIDNSDQNESSLFYIHRVTDKDGQGLWGIIQTGLIEKFRQGLQIEGIKKNKDLAQAIIPADADEKLESGLSSFLGKILDKKVDTSYIYNFHTDVMGRDANLIHPGQQVILIEFSAKELSSIYQFFSDKRNQGTETFAISG
jgi:hypothetical protein